MSNSPTLSETEAVRDAPEINNETPPVEIQQVDGNDEGDLVVEQRNLVVAKSDRGLGELYKWYQRGILIIDPEWQREYIWDNKRASRMIESLLIEIPIPVIYLAETHEGGYEVIDGQQRLTSVFNFFAGETKLKGLEILTDLNGKTFKELLPKTQNKLEFTP